MSVWVFDAAPRWRLSQGMKSIAKITCNDV
jgi:hypothetical protein